MAVASDKQAVLKKHSGAIHIDGTLKLLERKISNVLLCHAYENLLTERKHRIPVSTLTFFAGFNSNNQEALKQSCRRLMKITVDWDVMKESSGAKGFGKSSALLASASFENGICEYEYSSLLAEKLSGPDLYGLIDLNIQRDFTSGYALTIYEMCSRFKGILKKNKSPICYTQWYTIEQFKTLLGVQNADYCKEFKYLNIKIIKPAVNEINGVGKKYKGTDIEIKPEFKKAGRRVTDIRFVISHNKQFVLPLEQTENEKSRKLPEYHKLLEFGLADLAAIHVLRENTPEQIKNKIKLTEKAMNDGKIKSSIAGFFTAAIDNDYQPAKKETETLTKQKQERAKKKEQEESERRETEVNEKLLIEAGREIRKEFIDQLTDDENKNLLTEMRTLFPDMRGSIKNLNSGIVSGELGSRIPDYQEKIRRLIEQWDAEQEMMDTSL